LRWKSDWWTKRCASKPASSAGLAEGLAAYAREQADLQLKLQRSFVGIWGKSLEEEGNDVAIHGEDNDADGEDDEDLEGRDDEASYEWQEEEGEDTEDEEVDKR
jgi:hypothetical protein